MEKKNTFLSLGETSEKEKKHFLSLGESDKFVGP
jgi:hypothetical protein